MSRVLLLLMTCFVLAVPAVAAPAYGPPRLDEAVAPIVTPPLETSSPATSLNPMALLDQSGALLQSRAGTAPAGPSPSPNGGGLSVALNILVLLTILTLAPAVVLMTTCFIRILIVLGLLKQAIGTQSIPPAQVVTGLAMFMTAMVMAPTIDRVWTEAIEPWQAGEITDYGELWDRSKQPLRDYMFDQIEATGNWSSVYLMLNYQGIDTSEPESLTRADVNMPALVPAYMLSELKVAFLMGFRVYLPFLVIDMVIASILISMSMMMLPPVLISLPFKLLLFILVDGWTLVVGSLLESFVQDGQGGRVTAQAATLLLIPIAIARRSARDPGEGDPPQMPRLACPVFRKQQELAAVKGAP